MAYTHSYPEISNDRQPLFSFIKLIGAVLIAFSITYAFIYAFYLARGISLTKVIEATANPSAFPGLAQELLILQGIYSIGLFILSPIIHIYLFDKKPLSALNGFDSKINIISIALAAFIVIAFMPLNSWFIEWNQNIYFPEFLSGFEAWARDKEEAAKELTKLLVNIETLPDFILTFIVVAVVAGIGEELLFRGIIQNKLLAIFKNPHLAIWLAAILFSAFHLQFFGFFPRMFLGVLFGYLYYWSKNIWIPILAHFTNNGFTVIYMYLFNLKIVSYNIEETTKAPISSAITSLVITSALMFSFWKYYTGKKLLQ